MPLNESVRNAKGWDESPLQNLTVSMFRRRGRVDPIRRTSRCSLFAVGGLVFFLACLPMNARADIIVGASNGLSGMTLGTVGTEASACTNTACNTFSNVPNNSFVGHVDGAGGVAATADAEFGSNNLPAPALAFAQAYINDLSISTSAGTPTGANGAATAFAAFTDVVTFSSFLGVVEPFFQLSLDPDLSAVGGRTYQAVLSLYWYGPGTLCDSIDAAYGNSFCSAGSIAAPGAAPQGLALPELTDADTMLVFMSLSGDAAAGGSVSDPASIMISNLPEGVNVISEGGGTYTPAVPEPASWMMTATAAALLWVGWKRRSANRAPAD